MSQLDHLNAVCIYLQIGIRCPSERIPREASNNRPSHVNLETLLILCLYTASTHLPTIFAATTGKSTMFEMEPPARRHHGDQV